MRGMSVLDADGKEISRSTEATFSSGRLDSDDFELLREDLVRLVYERTREDVEYLFGDTITALDEDEAGVRVDFERAASRTFDLVIGADGLHSTVRRLAFGPEERFAHHLGSYLSVFSADNFLGLEDWQVWLSEGDIGYGVMAVRDNTELRVAFGFESEPLPRDADALRRTIVERLASLRWEGQRLAQAALDAPDFYCDAMAQIRMDRWSQGRVALLGDMRLLPFTALGTGHQPGAGGRPCAGRLPGRGAGRPCGGLRPLRGADAGLRRAEPVAGDRAPGRARPRGRHGARQERPFAGRLTAP